MDYFHRLLRRFHVVAGDEFLIAKIHFSIGDDRVDPNCAFRIPGYGLRSEREFSFLRRSGCCAHPSVFKEPRALRTFGGRDAGCYGQAEKNRRDFHAQRDYVCRVPVAILFSASDRKWV